MYPHGYYPVAFTTRFWSHKPRTTKLCLCVYDSEVKYFSKGDINYLLDSIKKHYAISTDWEGQNYLRLTIDWNYGEEYVDI